MRVLLTGGLGFVGANLIPVLEQDPRVASVTILDSLGSTANQRLMANLPRKFALVRGSICDPLLVVDLVRAADVVINLAAEAFVDKSILDSRQFVETNVSGTANLLDAIRGRGGRSELIHTSTDEVWGEVLCGAFNEDSPYQPRNPYAATKAAADHLVRAYGNTHGLRYTIVHLTNLYGRWMFPERLIPKTIVRVLAGRRIGLYGAGAQRRTWLHVNDAVAALALLLRAPRSQRTFGLGSPEEYTNLDTVRLICRLMGRNPEECVEYEQERPGHDFRYAVDFARIDRELGWRPTIRFEDGLTDLIGWTTERRSWWPI